MINSAIFPLSSMCTSSSMSECRKAPGISVTATYLFSYALMAHDIIIASSDTIGELMADFFMYSLCNLPSAHPVALMVPLWFSFENMRYWRALFRCSCDVSPFLNGSSVSCSCSWFSSFNRASFPFSPNSSMPCFTLNCIIMTCACGFANFLLADYCLSCVMMNFLFCSVGHDLMLYLWLVVVLHPSSASCSLSHVSGSIFICAMFIALDVLVSIELLGCSCTCTYPRTVIYSVC